MRTFDVEYVNAIANAPGVPELLGAESFDFTAAIKDRSNIFLAHGGAVGLFEWSAPRTYQGHLMFGPECRGRKAVRAAAAMRDHMFANHASMLWGQPPVGNCIAKLLRMIGFKPAGEGHNPLVGKVEYFTCHQ